MRRPWPKLLLLALAACTGVWATACMKVNFRAVTPEVRALSPTDLEDLLVGSSIQATRGTDLEWMRSEVRSALEQGAVFQVVDVDMVPEDWLTVSIAGVGGDGSSRKVTERIRRSGLEVQLDFPFVAMDVLSRHLGRKFNAVVRTESGEATVYALLAAAHLGVPLVDACLSGRARPELQQQVPTLAGISATPAVFVSPWEDIIVIERSADVYRTEELGRALSVSSGGSMAVAHTPMSGQELREGVVRRSLTEAMLYGRTVRLARRKGLDPVEELQRVSGGTRTFQGTVIRSDLEGRDGFTVGWIKLAGSGPFTGEHYLIYIKNEQIAGWRDRKIDILPPDSIWVLDPETGLPLTKLAEGKEVVVLGVSAPEIWRGRGGLELLGPEHFDLKSLTLPD